MLKLSTFKHTMNHDKLSATLLMPIHTIKAFFKPEGSQMMVRGQPVVHQRLESGRKASIFDIMHLNNFKNVLMFN